MRFKPLYTLGLVSLSLLLTACDQMRNSLGLDRVHPDEFAGDEHPPLSMPPSFDLKPPMAEKSAQSQSQATSQKAAALILKKPGTKGNPSAAEARLLEKATTEAPHPHIREVIQKEDKATQPQGDLAQKVLFWQKPKSVGEVIDPLEEKERLDKNKNESSPQEP